MSTIANFYKNQIKAQAREHDRFRRICVSVAQTLHRFDMRIRLGNIRDDSVARRRAEAEAAVRKFKPTTPTVKTEAEAKAEEEAIARAQQAASEATKPAPKPHIRPLSEAKAIESGAGFISETFLFLVAGGLIVFETVRARRKESTRREDVEERLVDLKNSEEASRKALLTLEKELLQLKAKQNGHTKSGHILPREIWEDEQPEETNDVEEEGWLSRAQSYISYISSAITGTGTVQRNESSPQDGAESRQPSSDSKPPQHSSEPEDAAKSPSTSKSG